MNKRHYEHTLPNIRGSLSNTYDLSEEEERIVKRLGKMPEGLQINTLVIDTNIPVNRMSALLFELEMKGVIRALAGGVYRLIM